MSSWAEIEPQSNLTPPWLSSEEDNDESLSESEVSEALLELEGDASFHFEDAFKGRFFLRLSLSILAVMAASSCDDISPYFSFTP